MNNIYRFQGYNNSFMMNCNSPASAVVTNSENILRLRQQFGTGKNHLDDGVYFAFMNYKHLLSGIILREEYELSPERELIRSIIDNEKLFAQGLNPLEKEILKSIGIDGGKR